MAQPTTTPTRTALLIARPSNRESSTVRESTLSTEYCCPWYECTRFGELWGLGKVGPSAAHRADPARVGGSSAASCNLHGGPHTCRTCRSTCACTYRSESTSTVQNAAGSMSVSVTTFYIGPESAHARPAPAARFSGWTASRASSIAPHEQHSAAWSLFRRCSRPRTEACRPRGSRLRERPLLRLAV